MRGALVTTGGIIALFSCSVKHILREKSLPLLRYFAILKEKLGRFPYERIRSGSGDPEPVHEQPDAGHFLR